MQKLEDIGWNSHFEELLAAGNFESGIPARVFRAYRGAYIVCSADGTELSAEVTGKLKHTAASQADLPAVGDWVVIDIRENENSATIKAILPRRTKLSRRISPAGRRRESGDPGREQVLAANIDAVFLTTSLNQDFNLRRIERYLATIAASGAQPIILLTKTDLCEDVETKLAEVAALAPTVPLHAVSAHTGENMNQLGAYFTRGFAAVLIGSSGVGKSTLVNWLMGGEIAAVSSIREKDGRGRHTTTARHLFMLPKGGLLIDTPGIRELQLWDVETGIDTTFEDIDKLALHCRFRDCRHQDEPGCAVKAAVERGAINESRYQGYLKLLKEKAFEGCHSGKQEDLKYKHEIKKLHTRQRRGTERSFRKP